MDELVPRGCNLIIRAGRAGSKEVAAKIIDNLKESRDRTRPELEYLTGAFLMYVGLAILLEHDIFPENTPGVGVELTRKMIHAANRTLDANPGSRELFIGGTVGAFSIPVIDGARRITKERLPHILAWFQVFVLHKTS